MGLSIGRSTCGIYRGVKSHKRAELCLLPAISPPPTYYRSVTCSHPYSWSGACGRGDKLSAIGFSVRKRNHHNYIEVQAAFLKRRVRWEAFEQQRNGGKPTSRMYGGIIHVGCERNPLIPLHLILVDIISEVLSQHTMAPLSTPLRFRTKRSRLNFLDLKDLAGVSKHSANEVGALISL